MTNHPPISDPVFVSTQQIVFIDSQLEDYHFLAQGILPGIQKVILDRHRDGIAQITEVLEQKNNFTSIHIVSHGSPGCLYLGNSQLSLDTLNQYQLELQTWFSQSPSPSVPQSPSLLIYGCNVAAGDAGEEFIAKLHHLTGAEIAASATHTGNAAQGGDWNLEVTTSNIPVSLPFQQSTLDNYSFVMGRPSPDKGYGLPDNASDLYFFEPDPSASPVPEATTPVSIRGERKKVWQRRK